MSQPDAVRPTDCFALLQEPRHPSLDTAALKQKFLRLSAEAHPDRVHESGPGAREEAGEHYAALNAAWTCLSDTKERLGHLLELERGQRPGEIHAIAPETAERFLQVAEVCRRVDEYLTRKAATTSPLLQARMIAETVGLADQIRDITDSIRKHEAAIESSLPALNSHWDQAPQLEDPARADTLPLHEIETSWRSLSYLKKWNQQLQDRLVQLAM